MPCLIIHSHDHFYVLKTLPRFRPNSLSLSTYKILCAFPQHCKILVRHFDNNSQGILFRWFVFVQESPVHHLSLLQTLVDMVSLKSRRPCMIALDALKNLFANVLLVPDRKLRMFGQCPVRNLDRLSGGNKDTRDKYLMIWLFEQVCAEFVLKILKKWKNLGKLKK